MGTVATVTSVKTALVAGATGLIGSQLLPLLLSSDRYEHVKVLTRKALQIEHPKLENLIVNFDQLSTVGQLLKADDVFCCLGTTMKKAKSKEAFRKVDYTYPLELAKLSKQQGARQYLLVSALGANKDSSIFYNAVKGEVEVAIDAVGFESLDIFRPSLLLGPRKEHRSGEDAAKWFYKIFGFLIPEKYQAIESVKVARAMLHFAGQDQPGKYIYESKSLQQC